MHQTASTSLAILMLSLSGTAFAEDVPTTIEGESGGFALPTLVINGQETANLLPVTTYDSLVSDLQFNPRVDLQARNMAEAQGDVSIRGGIFENTGFQVGAATIIDPQTGHYSAELPIAPEMMGNAQVLTGADNALYGFNSSVGTIKYDWSQIQDGGSATVGGGDHDLNFQRIHQAFTGDFANTDEWSWGVEAEYSRSESDGTIKHGDHDFNRTTGRVQLLGPESQTDFFAGYQEKFFGWTNLYTPFGVNETENLKTRLFSINHQQNYGTDSNWELSTYYRRHSDYYVYDRENPAIYNATHETKSGALAFAGKHEINEAFAINHSSQFTADNIDSTSLENNFTSRSYYKVSILPEYRMQLAENEKLSVRAGATYDDTNRDSSKVSPISDITWKRTHANGQFDKVYLSYAQATQVAGYTAIGGSETGGLFRSNYDLDRETSQNLELGFALDRTEWSFQSAVFYRWDDDLVDWTYSNSNTSARSANSVDIETFGIELIGTRRWGKVEGIISYAYLHKDEDYGDDNIDGSYYALNYPDHRATLGAIWRPIEMLEFRIDNEWRSQEDNDLRNGSNNAFFTVVGLSIFPPQIDGLELFASVDNAWDDDFEEVPGTPGRGDQVSVGATYRW
ncbi:MULTISPECIES: TonB-dependent siderophore receptor [unclassified Lentimonas]|uniref:TonB-dependent receptor plug domain-containing protein n=1 Tax=unclassified Lentimonas TaxID=2630993 RepID=UPI0013213C82|nr:MULTISPECIES: TonB-dependent receptor [unclassified Lentimonas]CAA6691819.1 TonB-dependent receptor precursor [Lentimonas sp. CC19]CAA6694566.1 TonB-dependent receptor precursor [Lentimonas sp. CC10]CAA7072107.1 TonB-dependent receptor precursor [Lentimonas sp. CC11]